ncbi:uncharacterized protein TNCV_1645571 [Trichonephila clavipes]|nr:uncharacterized protein TNCV_1645571 [Trichonephila clavipes]
MKIDEIDERIIFDSLSRPKSRNIIVDSEFSLGVKGESYSNLLTPILLKQIPSELVLEFNHSQKDEGFDLSALLQFLHLEIRSKERASQINSHKLCHYSPPPQDRTKNKGSYFPGQRMKPPPNRLSEFWNLENLGIEVEVSDEENIDNDIMSEFEAGISYQNKRYKVKFPWKPNMKTLLENNEEIARKRFLKLR